MEQHTISTSGNNSNTWDHFEEDNDDLLLVSEDVNLNMSSLRNDERYVGFDNNFGDTWIYPSNFPERAYQYNIVQKALFQNTLVVLPTGLGKTFIAAVVMYNMYRWYPMGKVVFMAPTKPLVAQQIDACCKIVGIPMEDSVEITGKLSKKKRAQLWQTKRVFFATPQSVQSDIMDTELGFPFNAIKLVVVDEAHKARGRYAYTDVISAIWEKNKYFRILALSATPGRRKDDVEEVIRNLFISSLEIRTEDSVDVVSYVHRRLLKTVVVELGEKLKAVRDELIVIADPHLRNLIDNHLISNRPGSISRNWLVMEQKRFREHLVNNQVPQQKELSSDFSICISIYHAIELLERHGTRVFLNNFDDSQEGGTKFVVKLKPDLRRLIQRIREETGQSPFVFSDQTMVNGGIASIPRNVDFGHPKFEIAREHMLEHFQKNQDARCIIFCEYRESVMLMHRLLLQHRPLIRPRIFVGQGSTGSMRAVTQREQINIMNDFRSGINNALIATSVAEEGIDVGEVDLIVCFDINTSNPTRFIQRIGRTGRKKQGKVLLLATEGKEYAVLKEVLSERNRLNKSISRGGEFASIFYKQAPRMVPTEFNPKCLKTFVQSNAVDSKLGGTNITQTKKKCQNPKNNQFRDLRYFFKPKVILNEDEIDIFDTVNESPVNSNAKSKTNDHLVVNEEPNIIEFSPVKIPKLNSKAMQKMVKYMKTSTKGKTTDVQKVLMSNKLSKSSIQLLIDFSPAAVYDIWSHMKTLWDKGVNEDVLPAKGLLPIDRKVVKSYHRLIDILGSKDKIAELLNNQKENRHNCLELFQKCGIILGDLYKKDTSRDNFDFLTEKLEKLSNLMIPNNCKEESFAQSMVYDTEAENESLQYSMQHEESRCDYTTEYIFDSKYMSQWDEPSYAPHNNQQTFNKQIKSDRKSVSNANHESDNSDEDVMFVGVTQQSTPIRTGSAKQRLLNFGNHQIAKAVANKKCIESKKVVTTENGCDSPNFSNEKHFNLEDDDLFDDQFDDIIAANSLILAHIESSDLGRKVISQSQDIDKKLSDHCIHTLNEPANLCSPAANSMHHSNNTNIPRKTDSNTIECMETKSAVILNDPSLKQYDYESTACKNKPTSNGNLNEVYHDLADIDFSEEFSDEIYNDLKTNSCEENREKSPDIFGDLSQSSKDLLDCKTPSKCVRFPSTEVSPCLLTKKALTWKEVRLKYGNSDSGIKCPLSKPNESLEELHESVIKIPAKNRLKRRIIDSDSDTSETNCPISSNLKEDLPTLKKEIRNSVFKKPRLYRQALNEFIDGEAVHSGSETEDEIEHTQGCYMIDSVIVHDDDAENDHVNMTGVYLQSVRSPRGSAIGRFKIPALRQYNDASQIFSQKVCDDNNSYEQDSFIISDEEDEVDQSLCPLERAELILKNRRRIRRNANRNNSKYVPKRKRVLRILNESDEDFE